MATAKPKRIWDNYEVIAEVPKNERLKFVFACAARDGFRCVVIREFYKRKADGVWMPGRDGVIVPLKSPFKRHDGSIDICEVMSDFAMAFQQAIEQAEEMELSNPDNAVYMTPKER